ncbi:VCBS repeat-containing protein [Nocardia sp. NPDC046763]|uniref:FG-GAP repeat domain-containing protein n=1 Tax=Nocardia sp. NPDC046763 TaxID=3155256 RepID=UPI0033DFE70D
MSRPAARCRCCHRSVSAGRNGDGTFAKPTVVQTGGLLPQCFDLADLNGDGILDMVVGNTATGNITLRYGRGDGTFGDPIDYSA